MKRYRIYLLLVFLSTILSINVTAQNQNQNQNQNRTVRAPLDGGLLAVLGAAGIGYFVTRKKKRVPGV
jgi:hypothetical protein